MADKYTLTEQLQGWSQPKPLKTVRILDFLKGKRRWPEGRDIGEDYWDYKEAGELSGLSGTFVRKKEDTMDERNKFANRSERFQTKIDRDRRKELYITEKIKEMFDYDPREYGDSIDSSIIRKFSAEFDRLSLLEGERMAQGGIVSLNQMTQPIGYR